MNSMLKPIPNRTTLALLFLVLAGSSVAPVLAQTSSDAATLLDKAIAAPHRTPAFKARDAYRHPKESLLFFGIRPDSHVAEIWPGAGWYAEILAPYLRDNGRYYAAHFHIDDKTTDAYRNSRIAFQEKLAKDPALYNRVIVTSVRAPEQTALAPRGSLDIVLTFRNVHNWAVESGNDLEMFKAFFDALKPGGVLGVVEHRAKPGTTLDEMKRSGYMTETYVINLGEKAGFKLGGRSEANANPKDTKDYAVGVWALPPTYRFGNVDRQKYADIGESDRMTLKFVKP
ncbi:MAG: class I SAM-dependent methyltransferase [Burkholderiales bacterium]